MVSPASSFSAWETETAESGSEGHPQLRKEFKEKLGFARLPSEKRTIIPVHLLFQADDLKSSLDMRACLLPHRVGPQLLPKQLHLPTS